MIEIHNLTKQYGRRLALADVSVTLPPGEITLLLGVNGAGKSTLLKCLLGIIDYAGDIRVAGLDPIADGTAVRSLVGYMPQSGGLHPDLTVRETLRFYADLRGVPTGRCAELLAEAGLSGQDETLVAELSGGMRQRLGFVVALLSDPPVLVLDEPSASLDAASRQWLADQLRCAASQGRTVIVSTHAGQELLDVGTRRIVLEEGRLASDVAKGGLSPFSPETGENGDRPRSSAARAMPLMWKELRDAVSNRWLVGYAVLLGTLGLAATATGLDSTSGLALQAFGRTTATLMNLCLLLSPLVAVLMGAASIAGERERGTLEHLLAQPISRTSLLLSKHAGLLLALSAATVAGFLPAGTVVAWTADGMVGRFLLFPLIAVVVAAAMSGIGLFISVSSRSAAQAQGAATFTWFGFVLLYDLMLMGSLAISDISPEWLTASLLANPVDAARVLGILALEPDLYLLGPSGAFLAAQFSNRGAAAVLLAALGMWTLLPVLAAIARFSLFSFRRPHLDHIQADAGAGAGIRRIADGDRVHGGRRCAGSAGG